jgi:hypothetical protein
MEHFDIPLVESLCDIASKSEYFMIAFTEKNSLPTGFWVEAYESKGFMESKLIQDFLLRGKPVFFKNRKAKVAKQT